MKVSPFHKILSRCLHHRAGTLQGGAVAVPLIFPGESGLLSLDAGLDLQEHDGKAQPWQRDGFSGSR